MKKLLSLALIGALSLSLTACGNNSSKDNSSSKETTTTKPSSTSTSNSAYYPKCNKSYTTLTKALASVHIDSSKETRTKIAKANEIKDYKFTAEQNNQMLILLKAGKLKKFK